MLAYGSRDEDLLFSTSAGGPISRATFRPRVWLPAVQRSGLRRHVRFHDLRDAHASWLLAGGADLKVVMDRLGHRQITTTQQYLGSLPTPANGSSPPRGDPEAEKLGGYSLRRISSMTSSAAVSMS